MIKIESNENKPKTSSKGIFDEIEEEEAKLAQNNVKPQNIKSNDGPDYLLIVLFIIMVIVVPYSYNYFQGIFGSASDGAAFSLLIFGPFVALAALSSIVGFIFALFVHLSPPKKIGKTDNVETNESKESTENNNIEKNQ